VVDVTGFPLQFIPHLMRGRNDEKDHFLTFYEAINIQLSIHKDRPIRLSFSRSDLVFSISSPPASRCEALRAGGGQVEIENANKKIFTR